MPKMPESTRKTSFPPSNAAKRSFSAPELPARNRRSSSLPPTTGGARYSRSSSVPNILWYGPGVMNMMSAGGMPYPYGQQMYGPPGERMVDFDRRSSGRKRSQSTGFQRPPLPGMPIPYGNMQPGMIPGIMPGMMPGVMPGMPMMPGMFPGPPFVHPMMAPGPCQLPSLTMVPPTNSQTCVVTLPGGGGSQPGVVPMMPFPMPTPAFMPPQVSGSQAPIIVAGTAQPQQTYPPYPPYAYPPQPQQPAQSNPLVETAAMTMMMQMIRAMLGTRTGGIRRRRPRPLMPMYPGDSPSLHVAISEGRRRSSALNRRKSSAATKGSEDAEGSKEEADKKSAKGGEEKDAQGKKAEMKGGGLKEPDGGAVRSGSGGSGSGNAVRSGSGGTSAGKGPDTNAPSLSLNFPSTTALGRHMPSSSDSDDTEYHFPFRCCCCFVLLAAAALACVILLAVYPKLLSRLLELLGIAKADDKKGSDDDQGNSSSLLKDIHGPFDSDLDIDHAPTFGPKLDMAETFAEVGVDELLQDSQLLGLVTPPPTAGLAMDWLIGVGLAPKAQPKIEKRRPGRPLRYFNERLLIKPNRTGSQNTTQHNKTFKNADNQAFEFPLPLPPEKSLREETDSTEGVRARTGLKPELNVHDYSTNAMPSSTSPSTMGTGTSSTNRSPSLTEGNVWTAEPVSTKSAIRELIDSLQLRRPKQTTAPPTAWPLQNKLPLFPGTVYFEWFPTEYPPSTTARPRRTRRHGNLITLNFQLPDVPTPDIGRMIFFKVFNDIGGDSRKRK